MLAKRFLMVISLVVCCAVAPVAGCGNGGQAVIPEPEPSTGEAPTGEEPVLDENEGP